MLGPRRIVDVDNCTDYQARPLIVRESQEVSKMLAVALQAARAFVSFLSAKAY
jgi:hypothetical protein